MFLKSGVGRKTPSVKKTVGAKTRDIASFQKNL